MSNKNKLTFRLRIFINVVCLPFAPFILIFHMIPEYIKEMKSFFKWLFNKREWKEMYWEFRLGRKFNQNEYRYFGKNHTLKGYSENE